LVRSYDRQPIPTNEKAQRLRDDGSRKLTNPVNLTCTGNLL